MLWLWDHRRVVYWICHRAFVSLTFYFQESGQGVKVLSITTERKGRILWAQGSHLNA